MKGWRVILVFLAVLALGLSMGQQARPPQRFGYKPNPRGVAAFLRELDQPLFAQAGADVIRKAKGVDTFLYRSAQKAHVARYGTPWVVGRQGIGDCCSWGWAHGVWIALCVDWETGGLEHPPELVATESIYGGSRVESRGWTEAGYVDGSYGGACAKWVRDWGVTFRLAYPADQGGHDLRVYSASRAKSWGNWGNGGQGDGGKFDAVAKRHPCRHVALVRNFDEAAAAIESGYPVPVASSAGFSSVRDADGFCRRQTVWMHCMCFVACRHGKRPGLLCLNSWGPTWVTGPKWPEDQPDGSFWVDRDVVDQMLSGEDSFAVGGVAGFAWRDLRNGDWLAPPPPEPTKPARPAKPRKSDTVPVAM